MNANKIDITDFRERASPERLVELTESVVNGSVSRTTAKSVLGRMFHTTPVGKSLTLLWNIEALSQISDSAELEAAIANVINSNVQAVSDYRAGKETALKFLVGQVMRATKGRANPVLAGELLQKKLKQVD